MFRVQQFSHTYNENIKDVYVDIMFFGFFKFYNFPFKHKKKVNKYGEIINNCFSEFKYL